MQPKARNRHPPHNHPHTDAHTHTSGNVRTGPPWLPLRLGWGPTGAGRYAEDNEAHPLQKKTAAKKTHGETAGPPAHLKEAGKKKNGK